MIESPLDTVALYDKLEKERAENDRLKEEIAYLKLEYGKLTYWAAEYKAENAKLRECVMLTSKASCYTEYEDACSFARQALKELDN